MEPAAVVRSAWDAYSAGDVDGALRLFAPDAEWHVADDFPGPAAFRGHDELRSLLDTASRFSRHHMAVTEVADMGGFVLAHGVVYAENGGDTVIDRVTIWRCRVEGERITSVHAQALPAGARWQESSPARAPAVASPPRGGSLHYRRNSG
jgi:ketosteroid isomerase-like protein